MTARRGPAKPRLRRHTRSALAAMLIALITLVLGATPALAHNVLVSSDPANGATLDAAPAQVSFTFDQPIENFDPALKVFGPGGNEFTTGAPTISGSTISAPMAAGPAGSYRAAYRIVSADGHPVTGEITFTLSASAAGTATGTPTSSAAQGATGSAASDAGGGGLGGWLWVIVAVAAVFIVAAVALALRRPSERH